MPTINGRACVANGRNLIVQSDLKYGYLNQDTGSVTVSGSDFHSDNYIATNGETVFTFSSPDYVFIGNSSADRVAMYDSNKNYLGFQPLASPTQTLSKSNVAYIRFSINFMKKGGTAGKLSDWLANHRYKLEKGSVATPLAPAPVDKVFSNGVQVYGRNLWITSKVIGGYFSYDTGNPNPRNASDAMILDPTMIPAGAKSLVMTVYNPNKIVNTKNTARVCFFNGFTFIGPKMSIYLTGDTVQNFRWDITPGADRVYLSAILGPDNVTVHDPSIHIKYEFGDVATPWTPAPEDVM